MANTSLVCLSRLRIKYAPSRKTALVSARRPASTAYTTLQDGNSRSCSSTRCEKWTMAEKFIGPKSSQNPSYFKQVCGRKQRNFCVDLKSGKNCPIHILSRTSCRNGVDAPEGAIAFAIQQFQLTQNCCFLGVAPTRGRFFNLWPLSFHGCIKQNIEVALYGAAFTEMSLYSELFLSNGPFFNSESRTLSVRNWARRAGAPIKI